MLDRLKALFTGRTRPQQAGSEADAEVDPAQASTRATGGRHDPDATDAHSTTGTSANETFVGRVAGDDVGYAGETGAEKRANPHG